MAVCARGVRRGPQSLSTFRRRGLVRQGSERGPSPVMRACNNHLRRVQSHGGARQQTTSKVQRRSRVHATNTSGYCADVLSSNAGRRPSRQPSCNQPMSAEPTLARWLANGLALTRPLRACEVGLKQFRGLMKLLGYNTKQL